jgi:hypothetical protein
MQPMAILGLVGHQPSESVKPLYVLPVMCDTCGLTHLYSLQKMGVAVSPKEA